MPGVTAWTGSGPAVDHLTTWVQRRWLAFAGNSEPVGPALIGHTMTLPGGQP
jgi:hypothetical protein